MISGHKGKEEVRNRVITALLQAYHDTLDYDGMRSILREAGLLELKNVRDIDPNESIDFISFQKIISAQNLLLYCCDDLLFEIGQKFAFYLFPYGKKFREIVSEINDLIRTNWKIEIVEESENEIVVSIQNGVFCSEIGTPRTLAVGFLVNSLKKNISSDLDVKFQEEKDYLKHPKYNDFSVKLKIVPCEKKTINNG